MALVEWKGKQCNLMTNLWMPWDNTGDGKQAARCSTLQRRSEVSVKAPFLCSSSGKEVVTQVTCLSHTLDYMHTGPIICTFLIRSLPRTECQLEVRHKTRGCSGMLNHQSERKLSCRKYREVTKMLNCCEFLAHALREIFDSSGPKELSPERGWPGLSSSSWESFVSRCSIRKKIILVWRCSSCITHRILDNLK